MCHLGPAFGLLLLPIQIYLELRLDQPKVVALCFSFFCHGLQKYRSPIAVIIYISWHMIYSRTAENEDVHAPSVVLCISWHMIYSRTWHSFWRSSGNNKITHTTVVPILHLCIRRFHSDRRHSVFLDGQDNKRAAHHAWIDRAERGH